MMFYYQVFVRSAQYRGTDALTYQHTERLAPGALVRVPLRSQSVPGFVVRLVPEPTFATKPIERVLDLPPLPRTTLGLAAWLQQFYPAPVGVIAQQFLPGELGSKHIRHDNPDRSLMAGTAPPAEPPLTAEQQAALAAIHQPDTYLLHGRTGSGKTRIYTELAGRMLADGRSALVLCPEIGLTSQLAASFRRLFGSQVVVLHSQLSPKDREMAWLAILTSQTPLVVIGPRSALFSPLQHIGLIVVDESHDQAYKQEQAPYYHAVRVASSLRTLHNATLVFGSATPAVSEYYVALRKRKTIIRLGQLATPQIRTHHLTVVDLKDRAQFSRTPHLSLPLLESISRSLDNHEQSLLYLNRRGTARMTLCQSCGWQALCPNCDLPLTYHGDEYLLRCHVCGHKQATVISCPVCGSSSITFRSFGTKAIADEAQRLFPEARILRFDTDNRKAERFAEQYQNIVDGKVDILIGTQLLAKGLDLPRLSTLGIILADSSLYLPDYTAQERTYQLLTQVAGRVGRGHVDSHAIIQTYQPDSPLLHAVLHNDWETFYNKEIRERKKYFFPPFCHLLKLTCQRASAASAERAAQGLKDTLAAQHLAIYVEGPAPAFHAQVGGKYRWQIVVKSTVRGALLEVITQLPAAGWSYDLDPADLL